MKLYELTESYKNIFELLEVDEFKDSEEVKKALDGVESDLKTKVNNIVGYIRNNQADITAIESEITRLTAMKKAKKDKTDWLEGYLRSNMETLDADGKGIKFETPLFKVSLSKPRPNRVEFDGNFNIQDLPPEFVKVTTTPDKTALKNALKEGRHFDGVILADTRTFRIS